MSDLSITPSTNGALISKQSTIRLSSKAIISRSTLLTIISPLWAFGGGQSCLANADFIDNPELSSFKLPATSTRSTQSFPSLPSPSWITPKLGDVNSFGNLPRQDSEIAPQKNSATYGPKDDQQPATSESAYQRHLARIEHTNGVLEVVFQLANALDAVETISCSHKINCSEANPLFGNKPSVAKVLAIKSVVGGLHYFIYKKRNHIEPKGIRFFEIVSTVVYAAVAGANFSKTF